MAVAVGREIYNVDADLVIARGVEYTSEELRSALDVPVRAQVEDAIGEGRIRSLLDSVSLTDFEQKQLAGVLGEDSEAEDWRVGEAFAETYLTDHKRCSFPWSDKWDERRSGSSLPGADLAGFEETDRAELPFRFAYGEVKTSSEERRTPKGTPQPPQVAYQLRDQLLDLRDSRRTRDTLFQYLAHRAVSADWQPTFQCAAKRYLASDTDIALFGVMIRDVKPHEADLKSSASTLSARFPPAMRMELLAVYLPAGSIDGFGKVVHTDKEGGNAD
jgi:hypothetical protein